MYQVTVGGGVPWILTVNETVSFSEQITSLYVWEKTGLSSFGFLGFSKTKKKLNNRYIFRLTATYNFNP